MSVFFTRITQYYTLCKYILHIHVSLKIKELYFGIEFALI